MENVSFSSLSLWEGKNHELKSLPCDKNGPKIVFTKEGVSAFYLLAMSILNTTFSLGEPS